MNFVKNNLFVAAAIAATLLLTANAPEGIAKKKASQTETKEVAAAVDTNGDPLVLMKTTKGDIQIRVFKKQAPITSANFLDLVNRGFYNGLSFHRYVKGFVIQGGDPTGTGNGNFTDPKTKKDRTIKLEKVAELNHDAPGMVAMARTSDPDSASCQFYFTLAAKPFLDNPPGYAVFGKVVSGLDTVMKLRAKDRMLKVSVVK